MVQCWDPQMTKFSIEGFRISYPQWDFEYRFYFLTFKLHLYASATSFSNPHHQPLGLLHPFQLLHMCLQIFHIVLHSFSAQQSFLISQASISYSLFSELRCSCYLTYFRNLSCVTQRGYQSRHPPFLTSFFQTSPAQALQRRYSSISPLSDFLNCFQLHLTLLQC